MKIDTYPARQRATKFVYEAQPICTWKVPKQPLHRCFWPNCRAQTLQANKKAGRTSTKHNTGFSLLDITQAWRELTWSNQPSQFAQPLTLPPPLCPEWPSNYCDCASAASTAGSSAAQTVPRTDTGLTLLRAQLTMAHHFWSQSTLLER